MAVSDEQILDAIRLLARTEGIFAETAGGVTIAVLQELVSSGEISPEERTVVYVTGSGLKTVEALAPSSTVSKTIEPSLDAFMEYLSQKRNTTMEGVSQCRLLLGFRLSYGH